MLFEYVIEDDDDDDSDDDSKYKDFGNYFFNYGFFIIILSYY